MHICFAFNVKKNLDYDVEDSQQDIEFDSIEVIEAIEASLKKLGHTVTRLEADLNAYDFLKNNKNKIDLVFNIAEGLGGDARESQIPIFCEMLGIPYTHSSPTTHAIKLKKHLTKDLLKSYGVLCPDSVVVSSLEELDALKMKFPLIVKPNKEGSSKGIFNDSVVNNKKDLESAVKRVLDSFDTEALVEQYIDGREITVALLGNPPKVLPIIEQKFDFMPEGFNKVAGYELKWIYEDSLKRPEDAYVCPANLTPNLQQEVEKISQMIWNALDVKDCARIDYRISQDGKLYFIEINTLPGINPDPTVISYFPIAVRAVGMTFEDLIDTIVKGAAQRFGI